MQFLRANLITAIAGFAPATLLKEPGNTSALQSAAIDAKDAAYAGALKNAERLFVDAGPGGSDSGESAARAAYAVAFALNAYVVEDASFAAKTSEACVAAIQAACSANYAYEIQVENAVWAALRSDCESIENRRPLTTVPLFNGVPSGSVAEDHVVQHFTALRSKLPSNWSFWFDWYDRTFYGEPQPWPLLLKVATQPSKFWKGSRNEVNRRIAMIESGESETGFTSNSEYAHLNRNLQPERGQNLLQRILTKIFSS